MLKTTDQIIKETAIKCNLSDVTVRKIVKGYYDAIDSRYLSRCAEFCDNWFSYRLNRIGRKVFITELRKEFSRYNVKRKERIVLKKYLFYYKKLLHFITNSIHLHN